MAPVTKQGEKDYRMSTTQQVALARAEAKRKESSVRFLKALDRVLGRVERLKIAVLGWLVIGLMAIGLITLIGIISEIVRR